MVAHSFPPRSSSGAIRNLNIVRNLSLTGARCTVLGHSPGDLSTSDSKIYDHGEGEFKLLPCREINLREALIQLKCRSTGLLKKIPLYARASGESRSPESAPPSDLSDDFSHTPGTGFQKFKDFITDSMALPDEHWGWVPFSVAGAVKHIRAKDVDVIYAVGKPWSCFLTGVILKMYYGKPLVIDFMDPWMANEWRPSKGRFLNLIESSLERLVVKNANFIIANTRELELNFQGRFDLEKESTGVVTCGFDSDFFKKVSAPNPSPGTPDKFIITHMGTFYNKRSPKQFLKAMKTLVDENVIPPEALEIRFIGRFHNYDTEMEGLITRGSLAGTVTLIPWVPHDQVVAHLKQADALLLIQPETHYQIPAKLYEYICLGKPVIALCEDSSAAGHIIRDEGWGYVVPNTDPGAIADTVHSLYKTRKDKGRLLAPSIDKIQKYTYFKLAQKTRQFLESAIRKA